MTCRIARRADSGSRGESHVFSTGCGIDWPWHGIDVKCTTKIRASRALQKCSGGLRARDVPFSSARRHRPRRYQTHHSSLPDAKKTLTHTELQAGPGGFILTTGLELGYRSSERKATQGGSGRKIKVSMGAAQRRQERWHTNIGSWPAPGKSSRPRAREVWLITRVFRACAITTEHQRGLDSGMREQPGRS